MRGKAPRPFVRIEPDMGAVGVFICVVSLAFFAIWFPAAAQSPALCGKFLFVTCFYFLMLFLMFSGGVYFIGVGFGRITLLKGGVLESRILLWKRTTRVSDVEGVCKATGYAEGEMFVLMGPRVSEAGIHTQWWRFPTSEKGEAFLREFWHGEVTKGGRR